MAGKVIWLIACWFGAVVGVAAAIWGFSGLARSGTEVADDGALIAGGIAALVAALLATFTAALRLPYADFMKGTTTARLVTSGWVLLIAFLFLISALHNAGLSKADGGEAGGQLGGDSSIVSLLGYGGLPAVLAFGLAEFHDARRKSRVKKATDAGDLN